MIEMKQEPIIEMRQVTKVFETDEVHTYALAGVDLIIEKGDYLSISGPSGCGKSTLLSILGLLDQASSGTYKIKGTDTSGLSLDSAAELRNDTIGFIFQSFNLIDELTVFDNVALPLRYRAEKLDSDTLKTRVKNCLEQVGLGHRMAHKPNQLSGGQQQRVAIARALVNESAILLVDEPTGNLDSKSGEQIMDLLSELNDKGCTICIVTHDPQFARRARIQYTLLDGKLNRKEAL